MNDAERGLFDESIQDCFDLYDAKPKDKGIWWSACHRYSLSEVARALMSHIQDPQWGNLPPKPAQIVGRLARICDDGHLPADEAWSVAVVAMDENETVVWTDEIAQAWGVAKTVMETGDEVGARMAFRSAYERRVAEARSQGRRAKWFPSLGHDPHKRAAALEEAAVKLRLPHLSHAALLEDRSEHPSSPEVDALVSAARRQMLMQAPRPDGEAPLDEIVAALPEDRTARRQALENMTPSMERRVRQVLNGAEKTRQLEALYRAMTPEQREDYDHNQRMKL